MEYARGRLFKDPSLPGMTAEERKVRVQRRRGGGGKFIRKTNTVERRAKGLATYVRFNELSLHRGVRYIEVFLYKRSTVDVAVYKNAYKFMPLALPSTP